MSEILTSIYDSDNSRRFSSLNRLYGTFTAQKIQQSHVVVVGIGGVGSWAAEALARTGLMRLTLIDLDHVAESNINRQVHALSSTVGQSKVLAMQARIVEINPMCHVECIDDFVSPDNWPSLLSDKPDVLIDACDQIRAKQALAIWSLQTKTPLVCVGAAGGKRFPHAVEVSDLALVTHDPLLARLRYRLRKHLHAPKNGVIGVECIFSRESVARAKVVDSIKQQESNLNCHVALFS